MFDVIIIGAGPVGLALAARLLNTKISFKIIEKGETVGNNILDWKHVQLFSPWHECADITSINLLKTSQQNKIKQDDIPYGYEFIDSYLKPLGMVKGINENLVFSARVEEVSKIENSANYSFEVSYSSGSENQKLLCKYVIDASGSWGNFNPFVKNHNSHESNIHYRIPNPKQKHEFKNKKVAVVGNGHSAMNSLLNLYDQTDITLNWLIRDTQPSFNKSRVEGRSKELEEKTENLLKGNKVVLIPDFEVAKIDKLGSQIRLESMSGKFVEGIDHVISNTGSVPNYSFLKNINISLDKELMSPKKLATKIKPHTNSCSAIKYELDDTFISKENYIVIGIKSYGKAPNFLLKSAYQILDDLVKLIINTLNNR